MHTTRRGRVAAAAAGLVAAAALTACGADPDPSVATPDAGSPAATSGAEPTVTPDATPAPTATAMPAEIPTDCRGMLSDDVLAQLTDVPLNDPAFGESGQRPDGSLHCIWADSGADTTHLQTVIEHMARGPALDLLNDLVDDGFTCYEPDDGVRCEKTWENSQYPVTDGRTLFYRDDILIDTAYSNLAPAGYTSSIVASIWG